MSSVDVQTAATAAPRSARAPRRSVALDAFKGAAILLVVVGHCVETAYSQFDDTLAFRLIYAFHMPLFMLISGVAASYSRDLRSARHLWRRVTTLVVPFVVWYALGYVLTGAYRTTSLADYVTRVVRSPDYGLWFLWVLFLCYICLTIALRLEAIVGPVAFALVFAAVHYAPVAIGGVGLLKWHLAFFGMGFLAARSRVRWRWQWGVVPSLAFVPLALQWHRVSPPDFQAELLARAAGWPVAHLGSALLQAYTYAVPLTGSILVMTVAAAAIRLRASSVTPLVLLAPFTLDIYAVHFYLLRWPMRGLLGVAVMAAIALGGSLALSLLVIRRSRILSQLLIGGRSSARRAVPGPTTEPTSAPGDAVPAVPAYASGSERPADSSA